MSDYIVVSDEQGSSPRMRGAHNRLCRRFRRLGIIPAYAGSTWCVWCYCPGLQDHPRVCGEHRQVEGLTGRQEGSSPRMRGAPTRRSALIAGGRIIPAYAGSTSCLANILWGASDHPRVCGEHPRERATRGRVKGSSPRMRGARVVFMGSSFLPGIIPAYAGSTCGNCPSKRAP